MINKRQLCKVVFVWCMLLATVRVLYVQYSTVSGVDEISDNPVQRAADGSMLESSEVSKTKANTAEAGTPATTTHKTTRPDINPSEAMVSETNTSEATIYETNTSEVTIYEANTSEATIYETNTSEAMIYETNTSEATVSETSTSEATVIETNTSEAMIYETNTSEAMIYETNTSEATVYETNTSEAIKPDTNSHEATTTTVKKLDSFETQTVEQQSDTKGLVLEETIRLNRIDILHRTCKKLGFNMSYQYNTADLNRLSRYFLIDRVHKLALNAIPKTGSTSWRFAMLNNSGSSKFNDARRTIVDGQKLPAIHSHGVFQENHTVPAKNISRVEFLHSLLNYYTVLTVRHPFDRLESTYNDKLIIQNYIHLREDILRLRNISDKEVERLAVNGRNVQFEEFLKYVLERTDSHWVSMFYKALPCTVSYRYIAKTESMDRDLSYIIHHKLSGHGSAIRLNSMRQAVVNKHGRFLPLFSKLINQTYWISQVMKTYKEDMELFGYSYLIKDRKVYATCKEYDHTGVCV